MLPPLIMTTSQHHIPYLQLPTKHTQLLHTSNVLRTPSAQPRCIQQPIIFFKVKKARSFTKMFILGACYSGYKTTPFPTRKMMCSLPIASTVPTTKNRVRSKSVQFQLPKDTRNKLLIPSYHKIRLKTPQLPVLTKPMC